ncbi:MAG TPA: helix-turn-helix transcriptional regulator [Candidatus Deferrimicrobium sp.]|nr:helix-turn-helix transcriptional regulator [Candidatus Kapabacteria bacterium]HLP62540.1 helix-turn-helix transcriptional regulator [Candidatus Deferrimicrobium sp.]
MKKKFHDAQHIINTEETGKRLKQFRHTIQLTLGALAEQCGLSIGMLSETESGHNKPSPNLMLALYRLYSMNINWLLTGEGEPIAQKLIPELPKNERGQVVHDIDSLLWFMDQVPMVKYATLCFFSKYYFENQDIIERIIHSQNE